MSQLERYKDFLIPVDDVLYVEYRKKNDYTIDPSKTVGTFVYVNVDSCFQRAIKISKKNVLDDFKAWYDQVMSRAVLKRKTSQSVENMPSVGTEPENGGPNETVDLSPHHCHVQTLSDGQTVVTILNGPESTARSCTAQQDGSEHPFI